MLILVVKKNTQNPEILRICAMTENLKELIDKIKVLPEKEMDMDKIKKLVKKVVCKNDD